MREKKNKKTKKQKTKTQNADVGSKRGSNHTLNLSE